MVKTKNMLFVVMFLVFIVTSPFQRLATAAQIPSSTGIEEKQKYFGESSEEEEKKPMTSYRFKEEILILYDSDNYLVSETAKKIYYSLKLVYLSIRLKSISSVSELKKQYVEENVWIIIYVFNTSLNGVQIGEETLEWKNFVSILMHARNIKHILAMGNTISLHKYVKNARNIYFGDAEQVDAELLFLYAAWTVAEILDTTGGKFKDAGLELRCLSIKYFGENFNDLLERNIIPKAPLGEEDQNAKIERFQRTLERFNKGFRKVGVLPPENYTVNDLSSNPLKISVEGLPPPRVEIKFRDKVNPEEELIISEIPFKSGLDGPIATVLDFLAAALMDVDTGIGDVLTISMGLAEQVKTVFDGVKVILGFVEGNTTSALKELFELIKDQFPFLEEYKKYFDLFISAIYALRGDLSEITNLISQIIELVFPEAADTIENLKNMLSELLDVGEEFYNRIKNSDNAFKEILSWFSEKISEGIIEKFLNQTLGLTETEIEESISKIVSTFNTLVNFLSTFNVTSLLINMREKVIQTAFNILNEAGDQEILEKATMIINLGMVILGYSSQSLKESLAIFLEKLVGESSFKDEFKGIKDTVQEILDIIDDAIKNKWENVNEFKAQIRTIIENALTSSTAISENMKNIVVNCITLIAGVLNDKFTKSELPTLIPIIVDIIEELKPGSSEITEKIEKIVETAVAIIGFIKDDDKLKQMISRTAEDFISQYGSPEDVIKNAVEFILSEILDESKFNQIKSKIVTLSEIGGAIYKIIESFEEDSLQGIMLTFLEGVGFSLLKHYYSEIELGNYTKILQVLFPRILGLEEVPTPEEALKIILSFLGNIDPTIKDTVEQVLGFVLNIRDIFTDGFKWIFNTVMGWLLGKVEELINDLMGDITGAIGDFSFVLYDGGFGLGLMGGESSLGFGIDVKLTLDLGIGFDKEAFIGMLSEMIFGGYDWDRGGIADIFKRLFSFFQFIPVFKAELGINGFGAAQKFLNLLLESIGMELQISGGGSFELQLLKFKGGSFDLSGFFKVIGWSFWFKIEMSKEFTILDFFSGGVGTSILADLMEYIGLDMIKIIISFGIGLEIVKRAASALGPEQSTFTLQIMIGAALSIPIDLLIIAITFYGSLEIVFTFIQNFVGSPPFKFMFDLIGYVEFTIDFRVLFFDKTWSWGPTSLVHYEYTAGSTDEEEVKNNSLGYDSDGDGLSDDYELNTPGLDPNSTDTDGDGLTDKEESQTMHTDPLNNDTDSDGLTDKEEIEQYHTNPRWDDSDNDGLTDYEEVKIYGTNPLCRDTDEDGLDDTFEITHTWYTNSTTKLTLSVKEVMIGGVPYANHTDPLNPDTDNDGLLDGEEGPLGPYYGLKDLYNESSPQVDQNPLIFGNGYTHPLDNDTDDDSYLQLWNGWIAPSKTFLRSMTDGEEVNGIWAVFIVNGTPKRMLIKTNPCNPDTDGDTGRDGNVYPDRFLNSDGYELHLVPPSDPLNGDSDGDGLIDGLEGTLRPDSNHTYYLDPDTDGDGLGDLQDLLLGTDPRNPDTDHDQVSDGDEYYKYGTNPVLPDTDFDLLTDGEELFFWHSNPHLMDSDGDGLIDGAEVLYYFTDPMDEDVDDDELTDYEELKIYFTNVLNPDTDGDGIWDGEEILVYLTNPFNWDSDKDTIVYPNEFGEMTWPMSDYDEIFIYGTDPLRSDTDGDGLMDSYELYLANGTIPNFENIPLDVRNNDTDGDEISDGAELRILNISDIIYPYLTLKPYYYYNSSPVLNDTDSDGLSDYDEIFVYGSFPNNNESDEDTIGDGVEVKIYGTDPSNNDTDGDGVDDYDEIFVYGTNPTDNDVDDDLLPDGLELYFSNSTLTKRTFLFTKQVNLDPFDPDVNNNGVLDGYEIDSDGDGLSDGEEFYIYETQTYPGGGFLNPDSDGDGLSDGAEVYEYKTSPTNPDSDGDGFSDGAEVAVGTDPTTWTSPEDYEESLNQFRKGVAIKIVSPKNETITDKTLDVRVVNSTNIVSMWGRYYDGTTWSSNFTLTYNLEDQQWVNGTLTWKKGSYRLQVFAKTVSGYIVWDEVYFTFKKPAILPLWLLITIVAAAVGAAVFLLFFFLKIKKKPVSHATETESEKKEEKREEQGNKKKTENISKIWGRKMRKIKTKMFRSLRHIIVLSIIAMFFFSSIQSATLPVTRDTNAYPQKYMSNDILTENLKSPGGRSYEGSYYPSDFDLFKYLSDNPNDYQRVWEPWLTKAAVHAIAASDDGQFLAVGGGYLYDNEIHIYRWNNETVQYEKVWDSGDGIIDGDVISLDFGDTDNNHFIEVVAGSADGHIYVFEQRHIYDPFTNTENQFNLVWKSKDMPPVWSIVVEDVDKDYKPDIIAGTWDNKVHIYEFINHSGYPFSEEQWITYDEVWNSGSILDGKVFSLAVGDTNYNALPEIIVGTYNGTIYIFENNGTVLYINGKPFPLTSDNKYRLIWNSSKIIWNPITSISVGDLDGDSCDEVVAVARGQGVYIIDYDSDSKTYVMQKLVKPLQTWEAMGAYPLDYWVDRMVNGSSVTYYENGTIYYEPINYTVTPSGVEPNITIYPMNTAMAGPKDGKYSQLNATINYIGGKFFFYDAVAILDFGRHEEATGNGNDSPDLNVTFIVGSGFEDSPDFNNLLFYVSLNGENFAQIPVEDLSNKSGSGEFYVGINLDNVLAENRWNYVRYIKIFVPASSMQRYAIDSVEVLTLYRPLDTAVTSTIGYLAINSSNVIFAKKDYNSIIIGTVEGRIIVFQYNETSKSFYQHWDSYEDVKFKADTNIWAIKEVNIPGRLPVWWTINPEGTEISMPTGQVYSSMTFFDIDEDKINDLIIGTQNGTLLVFYYSSGYNKYQFDETATTTYFNASSWSINRDSDYRKTALSACFVELDADETNSELILGYFNYSKSFGGNPAEDLYIAPYAGLDYCTYSVSDGYHKNQDLYRLEVTGYLETILSLSTTLPEVDAADIDGDEDMDLVMTNGRIYLLENIGTLDSPKFAVKFEYFASINSKYIGVKFAGPKLVDFDSDGDMDLIVSFADKTGATYFENIGTYDKPVWKERREMFTYPNPLRPQYDFSFSNLTDPTLLYYMEELGKQLLIYLFETNMLMYAYNNYTKKIVGFFVDFKTPTKFMIATYPKLAMYEICIADGDLMNFGYRISEVWNNNYDLENWTITVETGDIDNDGRKEVIVGDFDNNMYVFEHLRNNTYKRAYRSMDFIHTITTDESPYAWEELEGITGEFNRTIWDHVEHLVAGVDLDEDGKEEIIAAAHLSIYVFEWMGIDDQYTLIFHQDISKTGWSSFLENHDVIKITALEFGDDVDKKGEREIFFAAENYIFMIPCIGNDSFGELLLLNPISNPPYFEYDDYIAPSVLSFYQNLAINTVLSVDIDSDSEYELIFGGENSTNTFFTSNGFLRVLKYNLTAGKYETLWNAPEELTEKNPINIVIMDDQDYDGFRELIIGHEHGIDVWEINESRMFTKMEIITSSPNYPIIHLNKFLGLNRGSVQNTGKWFYGRNLDIYQLSNSTLMLIYAYDNGTNILDPSTNELVDAVRLYVILGSSDGRSWWSIYRLTNDSEYSDRDLLLQELEPSVVQLKNGEIWVAWRAETVSGTTRYCEIYYRKFSPLSGWSPVTRFGYSTSSIIYSPSIWEYNGTSNIVGLSYMLESTGEIRYKVYDGTWWWPIFWPFYYVVPNIGKSSSCSYEAVSADMINLADGGYALVFSGRFKNESKPDYDIWVYTANNSLVWKGRPMRLTVDPTEEGVPSISQLRSPDKSIVVVFESLGGYLDRRIQICYSKDYGRHWSKPEALSFEHPDLIITERYGQKAYNVSFGYPPDEYEVVDYEVYSPVITGLNGEGFTYAAIAYVKFAYRKPSTLIADDIVTGYNPTSNWTKYDIDSVITLAAGDTDMDARREIAANYYNKATLFEITHTGTIYQEHKQVWTSYELGGSVKDIEIEDPNKNTWPEIVVSAERGNVYSFEIADKTLPQTLLNASLIAWNYTVSPVEKIEFLETGVFDHGKPCIAVVTYHMKVFMLSSDGTLIWNKSVVSDSWMVYDVVTADLNEDGIDDIVLGGDDTNVYALSGRDGDLIWVFKDSPSTIRCLAKADLNMDNVSDILLGATNKVIYVVDGKTGVELWNISLPDYYALRLVTGNLTGDAVPDLIAVTRNSIHAFDGYSYVPLWSWNFSHTVNIYYDPPVLDLDDDSIDDVVIAEEVLYAISGRNGTVIWNNTDVNVTVGSLWDVRNLEIVDLDKDGILEIVVAMSAYSPLRYKLFVINAITGVTEWSAGQLGVIVSGGIVSDVDNDGTAEILLVSREALATGPGTIIVFDGLRKTVEWFYRVPDTYPTCIAVEDIDSDGVMDITVGMQSGTIYMVYETYLGK